MALGELLDQIRDYYVDRFVDTINEHAAAGDTTVAHECAYRDADGNFVTEGHLGLPARADAVIIRNGAVTDSLQIDTEGMLSFDSIVFDWPANDLQVELQPFQWNWIQLRIHGLPSDCDWNPLREWFMLWFRDDDPVDDELLGAVHFMSDPDERDEYCQVTLDLGTAPVEAFEELLDAICNMGAGRLHIGQFDEAA